MRANRGAKTRAAPWIFGLLLLLLPASADGAQYPGGIFHSDNHRFRVVVNDLGVWYLIERPRDADPPPGGYGNLDHKDRAVDKGRLEQRPLQGWVGEYGQAFVLLDAFPDRGQDIVLTIIVRGRGILAESFLLSVVDRGLVASFSRAGRSVDWLRGWWVDHDKDLLVLVLGDGPNSAEWSMVSAPPSVPSVVGVSLKTGRKTSVASDAYRRGMTFGAAERRWDAFQVARAHSVRRVSKSAHAQLKADAPILFQVRLALALQDGGDERGTEFLEERRSAAEAVLDDPTVDSIADAVATLIAIDGPARARLLTLLIAGSGEDRAIFHYLREHPGPDAYDALVALHTRLRRAPPTDEPADLDDAMMDRDLLPVLAGTGAPGVLDFLRDRLSRSTEQRVRRSAAKALGILDPSTLVEAVGARLDDLDAPSGAELVQAVAEVEGTLKALETWALTEDGEVSLAAVAGISASSDPAARVALLRLIEAEGGPVVAVATHFDRVPGQDAIGPLIRTLGEVKGNSPEAMAIVKALKICVRRDADGRPFGNKADKAGPWKKWGKKQGF
jgi:hypothetical protein